ncbi:MAG: Crp/Fnr family transcriptional regulator, partial [Chloroflexi bacterium CFX7]|nr:Crp/Fnr family transcriptional regulator [Chloroflexi bacterium CFX7]
TALFGGLSPEELVDLASYARMIGFPPQKDIFTEGQDCDGLWVLHSGRVRLYHTSMEGRQQVVGFRSAGSALELGPALDGRPYTVSGTSPDGAILAFLPRPALHEVSRFPSVVRGIIDQLCLELRQLDIATAVATLKDARRRVYCALLRLAQQFGQQAGDGSVRIDYRLTRRDIADISGVTLETAIRVLSDLQRHGIVRTESQVIEILDPARLEHPSECAECQLSCGVHERDWDRWDDPVPMVKPAIATGGNGHTAAAVPFRSISPRTALRTRRA